MKKMIVLAICVCLALLARQALANIAGSAHDFSSETWNPSGEICNVCHTPHNADTSVTDAPLWNHEITTTTFTVYNTGTLDATDVAQPSGASKLCLSCHDGTVALDNFAGSTGGTDFISGSDLIGTDLSGDHPISFTYNAALATADGDLHNPTTQTSGLGGTIQDDLLISDKMECSSCHDVHDKSGVGKLLVKSNGSSALCLTCHNK